jgi:hypothetical protein
MIILQDVLDTFRVRYHTDVELQNAHVENVSEIAEELLNEPKGPVHQRPSAQETAGAWGVAGDVRRDPPLRRCGRRF